MTERQEKKAEKMKRAAIHKILDLALDINGMQESKRSITGDHPTVFFDMSGHVGTIEVQIHPQGWEPDDHCDERLSVKTTIRDEEPLPSECTLYEAVRKLDRARTELGI